jgi:hypothetical protein
MLRCEIRQFELGAPDSVQLNTWTLSADGLATAGPQNHGARTKGERSPDFLRAFSGTRNIHRIFPRTNWDYARQIPSLDPGRLPPDDAHWSAVADAASHIAAEHLCDLLFSAPEIRMHHAFDLPRDRTAPGPHECRRAPGRTRRDPGGGAHPTSRATVNSFISRQRRRFASLLARPERSCSPV